MDNKNQLNLPGPVVRRLPRYYRQLDDLDYDGVERVSSQQLAQYMGLTASQVRQDFSGFAKLGQQGYGYGVKALRNEIAALLGVDGVHHAVIFGVGNIGSALVNNFEFRRYGFKLDAAFDKSPDIIGTNLGDVPVYDFRTFPSYLRVRPVDVAILSTPRSAARNTARYILESGVKCIWNFTNIDLKLDDNEAIVENIHFSDSLLCLSYRMAREAQSK